MARDVPEAMREEFSSRYSAKRSELIRLYPQAYKSVLHDDLLEQYVYSCLMVERYERDFAYDQEGKRTSAYLIMERSNRDSLLKQLQASLHAIQGEKSRVSVEVSPDFREHLRQALLDGQRDE